MYISISTSLKKKTAFYNITMGLLVFFIAWGLFRAFYLDFHEKYIVKSVVTLYEYIDNHYENTDEAIEWVSQTLNIHVHEVESIDVFNKCVPSVSNAEEIKISPSDRKKLEQGNHLVKKYKTKDFGVNMLVICYPVIENGNIDSLLFTYMPVNNPHLTPFGMPLRIVTMLTIVGIITFYIARKSFGKSYNQLQDLKRATKEVSKGNFDAKLLKSSEDELGEIFDIFNEMSTGLKTNRERVIEIVNDISHELKTPLTYIKTYNQALLDGIIQDPQEQYKSYQLIDRETNRLQNLIQRSLDFTKLDANVVDLVKQPIVFAQFIEEMMVKFEPIFQKQQIQFEMDLDYEVIINGDEERLEQIIQNIVQNAMRYSKGNPCIEMKLEKQGDKCLLSIADNGIGISEDHLAVITNRFVRVNKVRSSKESGTGIGLSIVEKLITLHGGEMKIESELGVGTMFKLIFPCID